MARARTPSHLTSKQCSPESNGAAATASIGSSTGSIRPSSGTVGGRRAACHAPSAKRPPAPFRDDLVVACECLFCWYWLADLCHQQKLAFVLGHAL